MSPDELETVLANVLQAQSAVHWTIYAGFIMAVAGLGFALFQLRQIAMQISDAKDAIVADHERSRRERTVDTLRFFQAQTKPEHNKMVKLLDLMSDNQLLNLREGNPISLAAELKELACSAMRPTFPDVYERYCSDKGMCEFTHPETMHLRFTMLDVLNHYEVCLLPWQLGICDKETMEEQFRVLVDKRDGQFKLQKIRGIIGVEKFPAIEAFLAQLIVTDTVVPEKKADLVSG